MISPTTRRVWTPERHFALRLTGSVLFFAVVAVPALAWTSVATTLQSITVSPTDVTTGGAATGTVTIGPVSKTTTSIQLASANTQLATVPPSAGIKAGGDRQSFGVRTVSGASGCTTIAATLGTTTKRAPIFVLPQATPSNSPVTVVVPANAVGGQTASGTVKLLGVPAGTHTVQLASSDPSFAGVPASVPVTARLTEAGVAVGSATFEITTQVTGNMRCSVISATAGGTTSRMLLKIFPISG